MNRRAFLRQSGVAASSLLLARALWGAPTSRRRPNIVLIVADDLGYADLSCQGCRDIPTPHIDSIASGGVRFTDAYVTCPICSPSRAGFLTGRYQQRFGHEFNPGPVEPVDFGIARSETLLPERLKAAGYATGMIGKWHLGTREGFTPLDRGFDEFYGLLHGNHSYVDLAPDGAHSIFRGRDPVEDEKLYLTDALGREAVAFVDRHAAEPFFFYLPFNAVHAPLDPHPRYVERFAGISDPTRRTFATMLASMDDAVGDVLAALKRHQLEADTLVVFLSDNGGPTRQTSSSNAPLRGFKTSLWEGGIRVPMLLKYPGVVPAGAVSQLMVSSLDLMPTALAAAGASSGQQELDGVDLAPFLNGAARGVPHEALFWRYGNQSAVRISSEKLIVRSGQPAQLYDLAADPGETTDLAGERPARVEALQKRLDAWNDSLVPPKWTTSPGAATQRRRPQRSR